MKLPSIAGFDPVDNIFETLTRGDKCVGVVVKNKAGFAEAMFVAQEYLDELDELRKVLGLRAIDVEGARILGIPVYVSPAFPFQLQDPDGQKGQD